MIFLCCLINSFVYLLFAGDTNEFLNGKNINTLIDTIPRKLTRLYILLLANKLTLKLSKTHFMVFYRAEHKLKYKILIEINKVPIEQVNHAQCIGVQFDDRLEWLNHITYINKKGAMRVGIICRAKNTSILKL